MKHVLTLAAIALAALGCEARGLSGKLAPDFTLEEVEGGSSSLSKYRGRAVLLNFWAVG